MIEMIKLVDIIVNIVIINIFYMFKIIEENMSMMRKNIG